MEPIRFLSYRYDVSFKISFCMKTSWSDECIKFDGVSEFDQSDVVLLRPWIVVAVFDNFFDTVICRLCSIIAWSKILIS